MFDNRSAGRLIHLICRQGYKYFEREMARFDLTGGSHLFLMTLLHKDGISQTCLTKRLHFDKANTARMVRKLEKAGYIRRAPDKNDARAMRLFVTEKARQLQPALEKILRHWTKILTTNLNDQEIAAALSLLERMAGNAVDEMSAPSANIDSK